MNSAQFTTQLYSSTFSNLWWLFLLAAILGIINSPAVKGILGEAQVNLLAKFRLDKNVYTLFKNVTLPTEDGTTQIDHVIVSTYGVFVIETKNMKGWIYGGANQKTWTQKIYRHTNKFQNPLHQNYKHVQILQSTLGIEPEKIFSLVVFIGNSDFKTSMPENVVYAGGYIRYIKNKQQRILTSQEIAAICDKIQFGRLKPSIKTHIQHVEHVRTIVEQKRQQAENACPRCGKPMILRTVKKGENQGSEFWGCSGFPKCRTMRPAT